MIQTLVRVYIPSALASGFESVGRGWRLAEWVLDVNGLKFQGDDLHAILGSKQLHFKKITCGYVR